MTKQVGNRYDVLATLGEGGMGQVLLVKDRVTDREVALKVVHAAAGAPSPDRLKQEFWTMTRLKHPHTVEVFDYGQLPDGTPYFTMEVVRGAGLDEVGAMEPEAVRGVLVQLARALGFIHAQGLIHRDVKPENVRLTPEGGVKLMDFGLMERAGQEGAPISGTLAYLAPEALKGAPLDARADLYSLGAVGYALLAGRPPYDSTDRSEVLAGHLRGRPTPPSELRPGVPADLEAVVLRLLAKDPQDRYATASDVIQALGVEAGQDGAAAPALLTPPFIGRVDALQNLADRFDAVLARRSAVPLLVRGPAGIGKTRLLTELRVTVQLAEVPYVVADAQAHGGAPYGLVVELLRQLAGLAQHRCPEVWLAHVPVLSTLLPELAAQVPGTASVPHLEPQQLRMRLQAAVAAVVYGLAARGGLVVVLEHLQGLDGASAEVVAYLLRNRTRPEGQAATELPLLVVGTARPATEGADSMGTHELPSAVAEQFEAVDLPPLSEPEVARLVGAMLGTPEPDPELSALVARVAEGNPRHVEELVGHLVATGQLRHRAGGWEPAGPVSDLTLPEGLRGALLSRLDRLPAEALQVARVAAVVGRPVDLSQVGRLVDLPEEARFAHLEELVQAGVLVFSHGRYAFSSDQLQEVVYDAIRPAERASLHEAVARDLEAGGDGAEVGLEVVTALAHHALRGTTPEKAIACCLEAGRLGVSLFANREAKAFLTDGLELLRELPEPDRYRAERLEYLELLGDAARVLVETDGAARHFAEALAVAEELDDPEAITRLLTSLGKVHLMRADYPEALQVLERSLALAGTRPVDAELVRCLTTIGRIKYFTGDTSGSKETFERALDLSRQLDDQPAQGECLAFLGYLLVSTDPERLDQGLAYLEDSLAIKQMLGDKIGLSDTYMLLGNAYLAMGEYPPAHECFSRYQRINFEIGQKDEEIFSQLNLAIVALEMGDFQGARDLAAEAEAAATALGSRYPVGMAVVLQGVARLQLGALAAGVEAVERGLALAEEIRNKYLEVLVRAYQAELLAELGDWQPAHEAGLAALALMDATGGKEAEIPLLATLGEIDAAQGNLDAASERLERARRQATEARAKGGLAKVHKGLVAVALSRGDLDGALVAAEEGVRLAEEVGATYLAGVLRWRQGQVQLALGDATLARQEFRLALQVAQERQSPLLAARAHAGLAATDPARWHVHQRLAEERFDALTAALPADWTDAQRAAFRAHAEGIVEATSADASRRADANLDVRLGALQRDVGQLASEVRDQQRRQAQVQRSADRLGFQVAFALALGQARSEAELLQLVAERLREALEADRAGIVLVVDGEVAGQRIAGAEGPDGAIAPEVRDEVLATGRAALVADGADEPSWHGRLDGRTVVAVPLPATAGGTGVLYADRARAEAGAFEDGDLAMLQALALLTANAVQSLHLHAEWEDKSRKLAMLNDLSRTISDTLVMEEVLELVVKLTLEVTRAERGFLLLIEPGTGGAPRPELVCRYAADRAGQDLIPEREAISQSICQKVLETGRPLRVADAMADAQFQFQKSVMALNLRTVMCVPLIAKNTTLGLLYVDSQAVVNNFSDRDLELLEAIANHASVAIENANLYSQLSRRAQELENMVALYEEANLRASTDALTGLNNRRFFQEQLTRDFSQAQRHHRPLSLIMLDIDHFKSFNDTYGHAVGDRVLGTVAQVITQVVRLADVAARFGGEEFIISLPDTDLEGARVVAERIREGIAATQVTDGDGQPIRQITVSLGVSTLVQGDDRIAEVIERADRALYAAKHAGRNRVETA